MSYVTVRQWSCSLSTAPTGRSTLVVPAHPRTFRPDVRLSSLVLSNALATKVPGLAGYFARQHELRLLLSYLDDAPRQPLTLRHAAFSASAGHIRRFVSECTGMGLLTAAAEELYNWRSHARLIANFDVLPTHLARTYPMRTGIRPDLLFALPGGPVAGEAGGRSRTTTPRSVQQGQRNRLDEILQWSQLHDGHPFIMSWTWLTPAGITMDVFHLQSPIWPAPVVPEHVRPSEPGRTRAQEPPEAEDPPSRASSPAQEEHGQWERTQNREEYGQWEQTQDREEPAGSQRRRRRASRTREPDPVSVSELLQDTMVQAAALTDQLYETAPAPDRADAKSLFDIPVRGQWAHADLLGPSPIQFFLGVLAEPVPPYAATADPSEDPKVGESSEDLDVQVNDRLIAVITKSAEVPPSWDRVQARLTGG